jgi:hypothetical protein
LSGGELRHSDIKLFYNQKEGVSLSIPNLPQPIGLWWRHINAHTERYPIIVWGNFDFGHRDFNSFFRQLQDRKIINHNAGKIVIGRKMHKDFFIKLISDVKSPLQTTEPPNRNKARDKEITDLETMLSGFFGGGDDDKSTPRVVDMNPAAARTAAHRATQSAQTAASNNNDLSQIRIVLNKENKTSRIVKIRRMEFNKIALEDIYEVGKNQMIKANIEATRERNRLRDTRNIFSTDAMYEYLLSDEENIASVDSDENVPLSAAPWRDQFRRI